MVEGLLNQSTRPGGKGLSTLRTRAQRALFIVVAGLLGISLIGPIATIASTDLVSGDTAIISTGGGDATLRDGPSASANSIGSIPDGTEVFIIDGPVSDSDGSFWYQAGIWDITGYINSTLLDSVDAAPAEEPEEEAAPAEEPAALLADNVPLAAQA